MQSCTLPYRVYSSLLPVPMHFKKKSFITKDAGLPCVYPLETYVRVCCVGGSLTDFNNLI